LNLGPLPAPLTEVSASDLPQSLEANPVQCLETDHMPFQHLYLTTIRDYLPISFDANTASLNIIGELCSSVGIVTRLRAGRSGATAFRLPLGSTKFSLPHRFQTGSGGHPASYPMDTGVKAAVA
jgi:hypothetical protein